MKEPDTYIFGEKFHKLLTLEFYNCIDFWLESESIGNGAASFIEQHGNNYMVKSRRCPINWIPVEGSIA